MLASFVCVAYTYTQKTWLHGTLWRDTILNRTTSQGWGTHYERKFKSWMRENKLPLVHHKVEGLQLEFPL